MIRHILILAIALFGIGAPAATALPPQAPEEALVLVQEEIVAQTRQPSRWSGRLRANPAVVGGLATWEGDIELSPDLWGPQSPQDILGIRDQILTHEMLHMVSRGSGNPSAIAANAGWEEGVVEGMRRMLQTAVLVRLGWDPAQAEAAHRQLEEVGGFYPRHLQDLERLRTALGRAPEAFYPVLLRTTVAQRRVTVARWLTRARGIEPATRRSALALTRATARLTRA